MSPYLKPDPLGVPRNPLAVYLLLLAMVSGLLSFTATTPTRNMNEALPPYAEYLWGGALFLGSTATLVGMYWQGRITTGLLLKRIGMFALSVACFVYSLVTIVAYHERGLFTAGVVLAFGVACAIQYHALNQRVRAILHASKEAGV